MTPTPPLILASSSPRRSQLLNEAGFPHRVVPPAVDDSNLERGDVSPTQWVTALAHLKARSVLDALPDHGAALVIAADTMIARGPDVIGQPRSADHATEIIRALRARSHSVITSVAYDAGRGIEWITDSAQVSVGDISEPDILEYVASGQWRGKAGAYNLYERIDAGWPITFTGDPATIMGLPMRRLTPIIESAIGTQHDTPHAP